MKDRYDFSDAEQGRFYTKSEDMVIPHYLKPSEAIVEKELALLEMLD